MLHTNAHRTRTMWRTVPDRRYIEILIIAQRTLCAHLIRNKLVHPYNINYMFDVPSFRCLLSFDIAFQRPMSVPFRHRRRRISILFVFMRAFLCLLLLN